MRRRHPAGLTLLELTVVLVILVALAAIVIPLISTTGEDARGKATHATMTNLREAAAAFYLDMSGVPFGPDKDHLNTTGVPNTLMDLLVRPQVTQDFDPVSRRGWHGPYVLNATGTFDATLDASFGLNGPFSDPLYNVKDGDPAFLDGWGKPIVLQWPQTVDPISMRAQYTRLVSAGPSGTSAIATIDTRRDKSMPAHPTSSLPSLPDERGNDVVLFLRTQDLYP